MAVNASIKNCNRVFHKHFPHKNPFDDYIGKALFLHNYPLTHFLIATVLSAVLGFFFLKRLDSDAPKVTDMAALVVCCALFSWTAIASVLEDLERKLNKWLELKDSPVTSSVNAIESCHQRRCDLEHSLVHAIAPGLVCRMDGKGIGEYIRAAANAILGAGQTSNSLDDAVILGMQAADALKRSAGFQSDQEAEAEIVAAGLTAARVTADQIQALMDKLTWRYEHEAGSRHTFAHAFLDDFYIATGHNAPISRENFDAQLGMKYAREQAEGKARDKLWELEGYKLMSQLKGEEA